MPRGVTLEQLIYNLRTEVGQSTNPSVSRSTRSRFISLLNRQQRRLYKAYEWPFIGIERDIKLQAGQRYYDFPDDIDMDESHRVEVKHGGLWQKVNYKITQHNLNEIDSDTDVRYDPVFRWDYHYEGDTDAVQMQVWPIPATDGIDATLEGYLRVYGSHKMKEMVNDADKCFLDSDLIVLYTAAEILAKLRSSDATAKLESANSLFTSLKGRATPSAPFKVGGDTYDMDRGGRRNIELRVAYAGQQEEP